jgi:5-methyltetrahydrofolate--homocysteine methyltransferase
VTRPKGDFIAIGENIHATRVVRREGPHVATAEDGREAVVFQDQTGATSYLPIPEEERRTQNYEEGRVKHVGIAVRAAMSGSEPDAATGLSYLQTMAVRQIGAGARYLDLNVDEISLRLGDQIAAMRWLVGAIGEVSSVPLSIDSSNLEIIGAGLEVAMNGTADKPMLNSASLERVDALELAGETGGPVIVTAAGESGMPSNAEERVANASRMVELALGKDIPIERIYVDPLVFPISVDGAFGKHCLDAIRELRTRYGPEIHVTGGMSNVSFGLPQRSLLNDAFLLLAIEAGADSGIIDPTVNDVESLQSLDTGARPFQLAFNVLTGADRYCREYVRAYRAGDLALPEAPDTAG